MALKTMVLKSKPRSKMTAKPAKTGKSMTTSKVKEVSGAQETFNQS